VLYMKVPCALTHERCLPYRLNYTERSSDTIETFANLHHCLRLRPPDRSTSSKRPTWKVSLVIAVICIPEANHQRTDVAQLQVAEPKLTKESDTSSPCFFCL
jgi:hypothetical protein